MLAPRLEDQGSQEKRLSSGGDFVVEQDEVMALSKVKPEKPKLEIIPTAEDMDAILLDQPIDRSSIISADITDTVRNLYDEGDEVGGVDFSLEGLFASREDNRRESIEEELHSLDEKLKVIDKSIDDAEKSDSPLKTQIFETLQESRYGILEEQKKLERILEEVDSSIEDEVRAGAEGVEVEEWDEEESVEKLLSKDDCERRLDEINEEYDSLKELYKTLSNNSIDRGRKVEIADKLVKLDDEADQLHEDLDRIIETLPEQIELVQNDDGEYVSVDDDRVGEYEDLEAYEGSSDDTREVDISGEEVAGPMEVESLFDF